MMCEVCRMTGDFDFMDGTLSRMEVDSPEFAAIGYNGELGVSPKRSRKVNFKGDLLMTKRKPPTTILALQTDPCVHKAKRTVKAFVVKKERLMLRAVSCKLEV
jgi:hypothetical protein